MDHVCYLSKAFSQEYLLNTISGKLKKKEFDAVVGCGISGALVVPLVAFLLKKRFAIVRKPNDCDNHSNRRCEGNLNHYDRWIFLDDLLDKGTTYLHTRKCVDNTGLFNYVGMYLYDKCKWIPENRIPQSFFGDPIHYENDNARYPEA